MGSILRASDANDPTQDAQKMAALLSKSVELSISMANMAELSGVPGDSVRVALAALASRLVAEIHTKTKNPPSENDLSRITSALQAVLTFSENFTPDADNTERLKALEARGVGADAHQIGIQYLQAFIPAVNAIGEFAFGQPEQKLIMDVSSKLTAKASNIRQELIGDLPEDAAQAVDLAILKALVELYATAHAAETQHLRTVNPEEQNVEKSLASVWSAFDTRAAMIEALAASLLPDANKAGGSAGTSKAPSAPAAPVEAPPAEPPKTQEAAPAAPPPPPAEKPATPPAGANPMAMFAKPKSDDAPPPAPEPAPEAAPESAPTPEAQPESAPAEDKPASGGNPMSFFKKGDE